jgi:16S rRNA (cytosine967-C5)-methyltransferase
MIAPARVAAYDILSAVGTGLTTLPDALATARTTLGDERDRALAADIALGVQRWRAALDHLIVSFSKRPIQRLDREVVDVLRLSAYQLLHLTRVPAAAVVDDAVNLTGRVGKRSAAGLVNAVLRTIARNRRALPLPPRPSGAEDGQRAIEYLSVTLSHPEWLASRWLHRFGFEATELWFQFDNTPAPLTLRASRLRNTADELIERLSRQQVVVSRGRFGPDALIVEDGQPLAGGGLDAGWFVVQDEASQLVSLLAGPDPGGRVLDCCASPGGKTTALAADMRGQGLLVACDVRGRRMELLRRTVAASGAENVRLVQADLLRPLPFSSRFDCVMVDAPCSGLGILRRDPDIKWRRREEDLRALAAAQLVMLGNAAEAVAPGGRLIYATCSSEPEENELVAEAFLARSPAFSACALATANTSVPPTVIDTRGHLRTCPHIHGLEGFFGAVFARL